VYFLLLISRKERIGNFSDAILGKWLIHGHEKKRGGSSAFVGIPVSAQIQKAAGDILPPWYDDTVGR
jgi:hypothetical protein